MLRTSNTIMTMSEKQNACIRQRCVLGLKWNNSNFRSVGIRDVQQEQNILTELLFYYPSGPSTSDWEGLAQIRFWVSLFPLLTGCSNAASEMQWFRDARWYSSSPELSLAISVDCSSKIWEVALQEKRKFWMTDLVTIFGRADQVVGDPWDRVGRNWKST